MKKMKTIASLVVLLCLLCAGCARDPGEFSLSPNFRLVGTVVEDRGSASSNWVALATGDEIKKVSYDGQDAQTNTIIWFHLRPQARKRAADAMCGIPTMTRFRVLRGEEVVADFALPPQIGGGVYIRTNREAALQILRELKR